MQLIIKAAFYYIESPPSRHSIFTHQAFNPRRDKLHEMQNNVIHPQTTSKRKINYSLFLQFNLLFIPKLTLPVLRFNSAR